MASRPTPVNDLLQRRLRQLADAAARHARVADLVREALPRELVDHCLGAVVNDDELVLYVDSPGWATRLRFLAPTLFTRLATHGITCRRSRVRVQPPGERVAPIAPTRQTVCAGPAAVRAVSSAAATAGSDELADALRRLASSLARRQPPA